MLCEAGHQVRVLEKLPGLGKSVGGVIVPPNMSKILSRWIGKDELRRISIINEVVPFVDGVICAKCYILRGLIYYVTVHTGKQIGEAVWRQDVMSETGGDYLVMSACLFVIILPICLLTSSSMKTCTVSSTISLFPQEPRSTLVQL
jgi:salicylate hydroxylase